MPVRRRESKRAVRARFEITPKIAAAFEAYISSPAQMGGGWIEHWDLHDALDEIGALDSPHIPPCCWHPHLAGLRWERIPEAVATYHHLNNARL
jgi:hypothetical protein